MGRRSVALALVGALVAAGCASRAPREVLERGIRPERVIALPAPDTHGTMPLDDAIRRRRSIRELRDDPLPLATLGQLLWAAQGVTAPDGRRAAPSAGARYPLELYVVTADRLLHYLPRGHRAEVRTVVDHRPALRAAAFGQAAVGEAAAVFVVVAVPARTRAKYGELGSRYVDREAGHAVQNLLLEATEQGLGAVPVGGFDPPRVARLLGLPSGQEVLYLVPVGEPRGR